jgi:hypothetical protein
MSSARAADVIIKAAQAIAPKTRLLTRVRDPFTRCKNFAITRNLSRGQVDGFTQVACQGRSVTSVNDPTRHVGGIRRFTAARS